MSNQSKGKFSSFIMGKGFYIALAICLAGAGTAAWVTVNSTMDSIQSAPFQEAPQAAPGQETPGSQLQQVTEEKQQPVPQPKTETQQVEQKTEDVKKDLTPSAQEPSSSLTQQSSSVESEPSKEAAAQSEQPIAQKKSYVLPINSKVMAPFSGDTLVENVTMKDWRTHNGIDIQAELGTDVLSACNGKVTNIKNDPLWGTVVEIVGDDGTELTYCGFNEKLNVKVNDYVNTGDKLGVLGEIPCEISLEPHLHFAVKQDGAFVDPVSLIKQ